MCSSLGRDKTLSTISGDHAIVAAISGGIFNTFISPVDRALRPLSLSRQFIMYSMPCAGGIDCIIAFSSSGIPNPTCSIVSVYFCFCCPTSIMDAPSRIPSPRPPNPSLITRVPVAISASPTPGVVMTPFIPPPNLSKKLRGPCASSTSTSSVSSNAPGG